MTPIENREIKGVTLRMIYTVIASTAIIVMAGFGAYNGIMKNIDSVAVKSNMTKFELDLLKVQVQNIEISQKEMNQRINKLEFQQK